MLVCPSCGYKYADFRQAGLLGCPECYAAFEGQLSPLLSRAHEGGTHHVGKVPWKEGETLDPDLAKRAEMHVTGGSSAGRTRSQHAAVGTTLGAAAAVSGGGVESNAERAQREARIVLLREQLADAVRSEQYEQAARLRDEIARLLAIGASAAKISTMPLAKKMPHHHPAPAPKPQGPQPGGSSDGGAGT